MRIRPLVPLLLLSLMVAACESTPDAPDSQDRTDELALGAFESRAPQEIRPTYRALSIPQRASLWRAHYRRTLLRDDLSAEQREALTDMVVNAERYLSTGLTPEQEARYDRLFGTMGTTIEPLGATAPAPAEVATDFYSPPAVECQTRWCSCCTCCAPDCYHQAPPWRCETQGCSATSSGCGTLWLQSCTKVCVYDQPPEDQLPDTEPIPDPELPEDPQDPEPPTP